MTRQEFIEDIRSWRDLIEFCNNNDAYSYVDDIYTDEDMDDYIEREAEEFISENGWTTFRDYLNDIPSGHEYYRRNGEMSFEYMDAHDLRDLKEEILDDGIVEFDEEDDEEGMEAVAEEETAVDAEPTPDEPIGIDALFTECSAVFQNAQREIDRRNEEARAREAAAAEEAKKRAEAEESEDAGFEDFLDMYYETQSRTQSRYA